MSENQETENTQTSTDEGLSSTSLLAELDEYIETLDTHIAGYKELIKTTDQRIKDTQNHLIQLRRIRRFANN